jgi:hypothetical protein
MELMSSEVSSGILKLVSWNTVSHYFPLVSFLSLIFFERHLFFCVLATQKEGTFWAGGVAQVVECLPSQYES